MSNLFCKLRTNDERTRSFWKLEGRVHAKLTLVSTLQEAHILVLELCERGELCNLLLKGSPLPPVVCQEYFRQLMSGIEYCHGKTKILAMRLLSRNRVDLQDVR